MTIITHGQAFFIKRDGQLHSTRYSSRDKALEASRRIAAGLAKFEPITAQINRQDTTNKL